MNASANWFARACRAIPGGVNSPVRAFGGVGGIPVCVTSGHGARLRTVDGRELTDFCGSWGPLILGHAHPKVVEAIWRAASRGTSFGINTPGEVELAERLCRLVPSMDRVRLVSSGTEAVMTAVRLARGATGRHKLIKFDGGYHGHSDAMLVAAGSGLLAHALSSSAGVPPAVAADVFVAPYNDADAVRRIVEAHGRELAAILVEPVAGNMGLVPPRDGFLDALRTEADRCGALLVFDEVITGFRLGPTAYGEIAGVRPDLTTLGKIVGGGLPVGAVGGRAAVMDHLAPLGRVYQAGTLSGNPLAVAAGSATLAILEEENPYPELERLGRRLSEGLAAAARAAAVPMHVAALGSLFTPFFRAGPAWNLADAKASDAAAYAKFFHALLDAGFYLPPSAFETAFLSAAHTAGDVDRFLEAAAAALRPAVTNAPA